MTFLIVFGSLIVLKTRRSVKIIAKIVGTTAELTAGVQIKTSFSKERAKIFPIAVNRTISKKAC